MWTILKTAKLERPPMKPGSAKAPKRGRQPRERSAQLAELRRRGVFARADAIRAGLPPTTISRLAASGRIASRVDGMFDYWSSRGETDHHPAPRFLETLTQLLAPRFELRLKDVRRACTIALGIRLPGVHVHRARLSDNRARLFYARRSYHDPFLVPWRARWPLSVSR